MIATVRTTIGRENLVIDNLAVRIKKHAIPIKSIVRPEELKGYIFLEGDVNDIEHAIKGMPHIRGLINKDIPMAEIEKFLIPEKSEIKIEIDDSVEIISGPFKGEKARITRIDETKNEITVEFMEAAIPIPVTIPINSVRIIEKGKKD